MPRSTLRRDMLRWLLNHVSSAVLAVLVTGATVALGTAAKGVQRRRRAGRPARDNDVRIATMELVGVAYAILVGFVIVSLWTSQQSAVDTVADEASSLDDLITLTAGMAPADATAIRDAVRQYATVEVDREWNRMRAGDASLTAGRQLDAVFTAIVRADSSTSLRASVQDKAIDDFKEVEDHRSRRLELAKDRLAGELWMLVLASSAGLVLLVTALETDDRWDVVATAVISTTIGLVLFVMMALSYPFSGQVAVSQRPFGEVVREIDQEAGR